mgnify:CR=1 FL=1
MKKYADSILMQDSVRDAFMVALKLNGNSMNTLDETELAAARDLLIKTEASCTGLRYRPGA